MTAPVVHHGDCIEVMRGMADDSIDAIVCDPPYGLEFMGKEWDAPWKAEGAHWRDASRLPGSHSTNPTPRPQNFGKAGAPFQAWCLQWATEALRILKPGGHLLAFGGTRTWHRLACAVEDAGFEIRDSIAWLYGSGFPKSLDVSKAIDKAAGAAREVIGSKLGQPGYSLTNGNGDHRTYSKGLGNTGSGQAECDITAPATDAARQWQGWGTALKPAFEPVVMARKPLVGTVAANVIAHGTGALNIDATRIGAGQDYYDKCSSVVGLGSNKDGATYGAFTQPRADSSAPAGRWPANVALDEDQAAALDQMSWSSGAHGSSRGKASANGVTGWRSSNRDTDHAGQGGASRFMYVAKASAKERPKTDPLAAPCKECGATVGQRCNAGTIPGSHPGRSIAHPTVKPLALMRWLIRLVTPPGGTVLDPFAGSGTTIEAAMLEGFDVVGIEREADYLPLIQARIDRNTYEQPDDRYGIDSFTLFDTEGDTA